MSWEDSVGVSNRLGENAWAGGAAQLGRCGVSSSEELSSARIAESVESARRSGASSDCCDKLGRTWVMGVLNAGSSSVVVLPMLRFRLIGLGVCTFSE